MCLCASEFELKMVVVVVMAGGESGMTRLLRKGRRWSDKWREEEKDCRGGKSRQTLYLILADGRCAAAIGFGCMYK